MSNALKTEEFQTKKSHTGIIILLIVLIIVGLGIYFIYQTTTTKKKESKKKVEEEEVTLLNSELQDIYGFAITDNYITALKKDGTNLKIYNLLQGTGNLGDFTYYTYYDEKLYLLFSDNSLYTISLKDGNRVYELTRNYTFNDLVCTNNTKGKTSDIAFNNTTIYLNTSSCGINRLSYDKKNKKTNLATLKIFNNSGVDFEYSKIDNSLYVKADNTISKFDMKTGEITPIVTNINTNIPLVIKSNILIYSNIQAGKTTYYGYNIKTKQSSTIVENANDLTLYNNSFIYRTNDTIYLLTNNKSKEIYKVHYNTLSNMQLINKDTLQVVDSDTTDETKKRVINIDLTSKKYETKQNNEEFSNIIEYTK